MGGGEFNISCLCLIGVFQQDVQPWKLASSIHNLLLKLRTRKTGALAPDLKKFLLVLVIMAEVRTGFSLVTVGLSFRH